MFDMTKLDLKTAADKGATITLRHPITDEEIMDGKKPVTITVLGADSKVFRDAIREQARKNMSNKKQENLDIDDMILRSAKLLAQCTLGWDGISEGKTAVEFSYDNALELYLKYDWIKTQVDDAIGERANFLQA